MNCAACDKCRPNPDNPTRCIYGGPFHIVEAEPIDEGVYIATAYGDALPPVFVGGQWRSQYQPWGPKYQSWRERLEALKHAQTAP